MRARLARVDDNLTSAEILLERALALGCEMVILPEFFTSAVAFHPEVAAAAMPLEGPALGLMRGAARQHGAYVGGSFLAQRGDDVYNTFALVFPDGRFATHDKDLPTMWENCYYLGGDDDGVMETPMGPVGSALCWEMIRTGTARRLLDRVNLLVGGSCWWDVPGRAIPMPGKRNASRVNLEVMKKTPVRMARMLGVPVVNAAHASEFECRMPLLPGLPYRSHFLGETMVVDAMGNVLARLSRAEGEGLAVAEVEPGRGAPSEEIPAGFWVPRLPPLIKAAWWYQNLHGKFYYRATERRRRQARR